VNATPADSGITFLESAVREMRERVDEEFGSGTYEALGRSWSAVFLRRPKTREQDVAVLSRALVSSGGWRIHEPGALRTLHLAAKSHRRSVQAEQVEFAAHGLWWASAQLREPQTIRFGRSRRLPGERRDEWLTDSCGNLLVPRRIANQPSVVALLGRGRWFRDGRGRRVRVVPDGLDPGSKLIWYAAAAKRAAEQVLTDDAAESLPGETVPIELVGPEVVAAVSGLDDGRQLAFVPTRLDVLVAAEEAEETRSRIAALLEMASPQQRAILTGTLAHLEAGRSESEARVAVANDLGIAPATVRVHFHRLREKAIGAGL